MKQPKIKSPISNQIICFPMKFYGIFLALFCTTAFNAHGRATIQQNLVAINGRVVLIKAHQYVGSYVDATSGGSTAKVTEISSSDLEDPVKAAPYKFIVHHLGDDLVAFESFAKRNYFIDMNSWDHLGITKYNDIPTDSSCPDWLQHRIADLSYNGDMTQCTLSDVRWTGDRYWDSHWTQKLAATYNDGYPSGTQKWGRWTIMFPQPISVETNTFDICNETSEPVTHTVSQSVGITKGISDTHSMTSSLTLEMSMNIPFVSEMDAGGISGGAKLTTSQTFSTTKSTTWSKATKTTNLVVVAPFKHVRITSTHVTYGGVSGFTIHDGNLTTEEVGDAQPGGGCHTDNSTPIMLP